MALRDWEPFRELIQQNDRMRRLLQEGFGADSLGISLPAVDVYEENDKLVIEAMLPDFDEKDIEVNLTEDGLEIKAQHSSDSEIKERKYIMRETTSGSFYRYINLPAGVRTDQARASFDRGVLRIEILRQQQAQPQRLAIRSSAPKPGASLKDRLTKSEGKI